MKNNHASKAIDLFHTIENPNEVILLLVFNACAQLQSNEALLLVKRVSANMPGSFRTHAHLMGSLLVALMKCGDMKSAELLFSQMERSVISYASLMTGFNHNDQPEQTLNLFYRMKTESLEPNSFVYLYVIKALAQLGDSSLSKTIVEQMPKVHLENDWIRNALVDMWVSVDRRQDLSLSVSRQ